MTTKSNPYGQIKPGRFVNPVEVIKSFGLKEGTQFADFGSGGGAYVLTAAPLVGQTGAVYAVDIQKDLLLRLKQAVADASYTNVKFLWCNFEELRATQLPDMSVDVVVISNTLFQLDNKNGALLEANRVLKNDGKLYIIDWSESFKGMGPDKGKVVTESSAVDFATAAGFVLDSKFDPGQHHYGLTLIKQ